MKLVRVVKMKSFMSLLVFAASMSLLATTEKVGDYTWNYRINGNTAEIYQESTQAAISPYPTGAVTIPSTLGGKPVTKIGQYAFHQCRGLTSVTIPDSVTSIDGFSDCTNLVSITIPDSVTRIEWGAFARCSGLTNITIPNSVTNIGMGAFQDCVGLVSMTLPFIGMQRGYSSVRDALFFGYIFAGGGGSSQYSSLEYEAEQYYPNNQKSYYIPRSLETVIVADETEICAGAFSGCKRLKNVIICDGPKYIRYYAFYNCGGLSNVTLPDSVTQIDERAFFGCDGLTNITIPRNVTKISPSVFSCNRLTSVMFLGSAPTVYTNTFVKVAASCTAYVKRFASWGWGVAIPGTWNGIAIDYVPEIIPEIPSGCSSKGVTNAIEAAGFADEAAVKSAIGGRAEEYGMFKTWAQRVKYPVTSASSAYVAGESAVVANTNAAAAFMLGAERLFEKAPRIEFGEMEMRRQDAGSPSQGDDGGAGSQGVTVSVVVKDGEDAVRCAAEKVKEMFEATRELGDWEGEARLTPTVDVLDGDGETMRFRVTPGDGKSSSAFLRIRK